MKKILSLLMSLGMILSAVSCESKVEKVTPADSSETAFSSSGATNLNAEDIHSYKQEKIDIEGSFYQVASLSDGRYRIFGSGSENNLSIYDTDSEFRNFTPFESELGLTPDYYTIAPADDGSMYAIVTHVTHGDMPEMPDDYDENFDYEAYYEASEYEYSLAGFDSNGKKVSEVPLGWISEYANEYSYGQASINSLIYCGNDMLIANIENSLVFINCKDGTQLEKLDTGEKSIYSLYTDRNGNAVFLYESYDNNSDSMLYGICGIDAENRKISDDDISFSENINGYMRGSGKYKYYLSFADGIYGITDDGKKELIIDFVDSDMLSNNIFPLAVLENGDVIINDYSQESGNLIRCIKRSPDEITDKKVITVGYFTTDDYTINSEINKFNKSHDDIQAKIRQIESYDQLRLDIISGNAPDVILSCDLPTVKSLGKKGVFANLYDLMENDSEVNKNIVMPNVMKVCESNDGNLYILPQSFYVEAGFVKTKYFNKQELTFDELIELYNKYPEKARAYHTRTDMFSEIFSSSDDFVDYENAVCSFDSPEFIKLLEFCNEFPQEIDKPDKENDPEGLDNYYYERVFDFIKDRDLIAYQRFYDFNSFNYYKYGYFSNDDAEIVNCPSVDESRAKIGFNSGFVISEKSADKQACWEFIKSFLSEENQQCGNGYGNGFPAMKEYFYKSADESMKEQDINEQFKGTGEKIPPLSQQERDFYCDYIMNADSCVDYYSQSIIDICHEETDAYFNGGQTAQQTAEYIQSRVSILLSEQS